MSSRMLARIVIVCLVLVGIGSYSVFEFRYIIGGPKINIETPTNGEISKTSVADIKGHAANISRINMNGRDISVNEEGQFQEKFVLANGSNVVKISAEDRFGRKNEKLVEIFYTEPGEPLVLR